jgi:rSAM/selenodomain-associated transferase 1
MAERHDTRRNGATLAVMAKAPIPGFAKTRLIPRLGPEGAAALHAVLLERTLRIAASSGFDAVVALWCAPDRRSPFFEALRLSAALDLDLHDQPEGDLGARMLAVFETHLPAGGPVVLVGTDCPELSSEHLASCRAALAGGSLRGRRHAGADVVLLPARDGGYAAIGLARVDRSLFDGVPWGSSEVLAVTRERIRRLGWRAHELSPVRDVDEPEDVEWLLASGLLTPAEEARIGLCVESE